MVDVVPASLSYTGGSLRTTRVVPARFRLTGGTFTVTIETPTTTAAEIPKLDRIMRQERIVGSDDTASQRFQLIWQQTMVAIESAFEAVNARVDEVAILARLSAVEAKADAANDNAVAAQSQVAVTSAAVQATLTQIDPTYGDYYEDTYNNGGAIP